MPCRCSSQEGARRNATVIRVAQPYSPVGGRLVDRPTLIAPWSAHRREGTARRSGFRAYDDVARMRKLRSRCWSSKESGVHPPDGRAPLDASFSSSGAKARRPLQGTRVSVGSMSAFFLCRCAILSARVLHMDGFERARSCPHRGSVAPWSSANLIIASPLYRETCRVRGNTSDRSMGC